MRAPDHGGGGRQVLTSPCATVGSRTGKERGNNFSQSAAAMRRGEDKMDFLRRKVPTHYIPIHPHNVSNKDWIILLEAGTIVGPSAEKLRVAQATLEKKIAKRYNIFLRPKHYLVLDGYDPRIHTLYFCPQLYRSDDDKKLVSLEGEEIGR